MQAETIYLDYNATCPVHPAAADAVADALIAGGNPSSVHAAGRHARRTVEQARAAVADLAGAAASSVIFTSGASEANVLALRGLPLRRVLVSAIEHDSVLNAVPDAVALPVSDDGTLNLAALSENLAEGDLLSVMAVNNETGVIQSLQDIADRAAQAGARLHVDAVQAAGRIPLDFRGLGLAAMSLSAHKIGGPPGVGALVIDEGLTLTAQTRGGGQERGRRGGTENTAGIAGFGAAARIAIDGLNTEPARQAALRDRLEAGIAAAVDGVRIIGCHGPRVANTSCILLPGVAAEKQVMALDLDGFAVSAGSACSSGKVKASHVLTAMGLGDADAGAAIRVSLGWKTTAAEVDAFIAAYGAMAGRLLKSARAGE